MSDRNLSHVFFLQPVEYSSYHSSRASSRASSARTSPVVRVTKPVLFLSNMSVKTCLVTWVLLTSCMGWSAVVHVELEAVWLETKTCFLCLLWLYKIEIFQGLSAPEKMFGQVKT
ncbi:hypothetical protein XENORESO_019497 [Xenotaenia resolanae]|uniref:Uncharacterized protein n=1 Tax=Xenotaenia resolanae TaxID=208358 RepID=A0ABV0WH90_9TELE